MKRAELKKIRQDLDRMNDLKSKGMSADSLRYEILPRAIMAEVDFFVSCAEKVMDEQRQLL